jgi:hypothetical protein
MPLESAKLGLLAPEWEGLLHSDDDVIMHDNDGPPEPIQESLSGDHEDGETAKRRKLDLASEQAGIIAERLQPAKPPKKSPTPGMHITLYIDFTSDLVNILGFRPNTRASSRHQSSTPAEPGGLSMDVDWSNIVPHDILVSITPSQTRPSSPKASTSKLDPGP